MRIAINADYLAEPQTGVGRYVAQLVEALGTTDGVNTYLALHHRPLAARPATPSTFEWEQVAVSGPSEQLRKVRWEQRAFPEAARKAGARMLFVPYFAPPVLTNLPVVVTIHDVIPFVLPEYRPLGALWAYFQVAAQGARRAGRVITPTAHAKGEVIRVLGVPAERILVIPEAPTLRFRPVADHAVLRATAAKYHAGERFVLYLGGFDRRKNVPLLIGAFAATAHRLGDPHLRLVLSGKTAPLGTGPLFPDWRILARKLGIESRVVSAVISDADLPAMYSASSAFVYPSSYEGFGLPPLEAMACGAPVITSNHPALLEVAGAASLPFELPPEGHPASEATRALADRLTRLLADDQLREDYRMRGLARARDFNWSLVAGETSAVFSDLFGGRA